MTEQWQAIDGYEGVYEVSNQGRVRRVAGSHGARRNRLLRPGLNGAGYHFVQLWRGNQGHVFQVHTLVAQTFCARPIGTTEVNHKDGVKLHNAAENLEWVTRADNHRHAIRTGLRPNNAAHLERIRPLTVAWHRSVEGRAWHRAHALRVAAHSRPLRALHCLQCGQGYETRYQGRNARFCAPSCANAWFALHQLKEPRCCANCGGPFMAERRHQQRYCSRRCAGQVNGRQRWKLKESSP